MISLPNPDVLPIISASDWPEPVKHLSSQLRPVLPCSILSRREHVPDNTAAVFTELRDILNENCLHDNNPHEPDHLFQLRNPLLAAVAVARELKGSRAVMKSAICIFYSLERLLWHGSSFRLIDNASFLLPCTENLRAVLTGLDLMVDGHAIFTLSYNISDPTYGSSHVIACSRRSDSATLDHSDRASSEEAEGGADSKEAEDSKTQVDSESIADIDEFDDAASETTNSELTADSTHANERGSSFPLNAHVLHPPGLRTSADVLILVVADADNIISLMTSTIYQRYVWSIDAPVVGFEISQSSPSIRVMFGWFTHGEGGQPVVHIVSAARKIGSNLTLGLYDLTDPFATFSLAQFIINLQPHVNAVAEAASDCSLCEFNWRLDHHVDLDMISVNRKVKVRKWLEYFPSPEPEPERFVFSEERIIRELPEDSEDHQDTKSTRPKLHRGLGESPYSTSHFILHREGEMIANLTPVPKVIDSENISKMKTLYDTVTQSIIIPKWLCMDSIFLTNPDALVPHRDKLLIQNREYCNAQDAGDYIILSDDLSSILEDRVEPLLWCCALADKKERLSEMEIDNIWSIFLSTFCADTQSSSMATHIQYEVDVQFSRNRVLDEILRTLPQVDGPAPERTMDEVKNYMNHLCVYGRMHCAHDCSANRKERDKLIPSLFHAMAIQTETFDLCDMDDYEIVTHVWNRADQEPHNGRCNAVISQPAVIRVPHSTCIAKLPFPEELSFIYDSYRSPDASQNEGFPERVSVTPPSIRASMHEEPCDPQSSSLAANPKRLMLPIVLVDFRAVQEVWPPIYARFFSALDLYARLGFRDHPIWGLNVVHDGLHCEIICGWRSSTSNRSYMLQRMLKTYNIADPFEAMQLAAFLLRVRSNLPELIVNDPEVLALYETREPDVIDHSTEAGDMGTVILEIGPDTKDRWPKWTKAFQDPIPEEYRREWVDFDDGEDDIPFDDGEYEDRYSFYKEENWGWDKK